MLPDAATPLLPCFHPTTVVHVEDSARYATLLQSILQPDIHVASCESASVALRLIEQARTRGGASTRLNASVSRGDAHSSSTMADVREVMFDAQRFTDISVAIVDYAMPDIDGLEFCRRIADCAIGRIMLTARADRETGSAALRDGLIEYFIDKTSPTFLADLRAAVSALQISYFGGRDGCAVKTIAAPARFAFTREPEVAAAMRRYLAITPVEMYVCDDPAGVLYIDADGLAEFVLVLLEEDYHARLAQALHAGAPEWYIRHLRSRQWLSWHGAEAGFYDPRQTLEADDLIRATTLKGSCGDFVIATLDSVQVWRNDGYTPYRDWLGVRDAAARSG